MLCSTAIAKADTCLYSPIICAGTCFKTYGAGAKAVYIGSTDNTATLLLDGSDGDFSGSDYAWIRHDNSKVLKIENDQVASHICIWNRSNNAICFGTNNSGRLVIHNGGAVQACGVLCANTSIVSCGTSQGVKLCLSGSTGDNASPRGEVAKHVRWNYAPSSCWRYCPTGNNSQDSPDSNAFHAVAECNRTCYGIDPWGRRSLIWHSYQNDTASDADGGWTKGICNLDPKRSYLSVIYLKKLVAGNNSGSFYHGTGSGANDIRNIDGSANTNPYFMSSGISNFEEGQWYVSVGYIVGCDDTSSSYNGGVYRLCDGTKTRTNTTYRMGSSTCHSNGHRVYLYYSDGGDEVVQWWGPGFYEMNGMEPSFGELLNGNPAAHNKSSNVENTLKIQNVCATTCMKSTCICATSNMLFEGTLYAVGGAGGHWDTNRLCAATCVVTPVVFPSGCLQFDQTGTRSWKVCASGGNLNFHSGDGSGTFYFHSQVYSNVFCGTSCVQTNILRNHSGNPYLNVYSGCTAPGGIYLRACDGTARGYVYFDGTSNFGLLNCSGQWGLRIEGNHSSGMMCAYHPLCALTCVKSPLLCAETRVRIGNVDLTNSNDTRLKLCGSGDNYMIYGPANDNGWGYIQSVNNANGMYLETQQGRFAFDTGHLSGYNDAEIDVGVTNNRFRCANFSCNIYGKYLHSETFVYAGSCMCSAILCATGSMKAPTICSTGHLNSPRLCLAGDPSGDMANGVTLGRTGGLPQALWGESGSTTGRIEIGLPTLDGEGGSTHHGMVHVAIDVYEYNNNNATTIIVGGHNWNCRWYNCGAHITGGCSDKSIKLAYHSCGGTSDGRYVILLGECDSTWSYGSVHVRSITNGLFYCNAMNMCTPWYLKRVTCTDSYYNCASTDLRTSSKSMAGYQCAMTCLHTPRVCATTCVKSTVLCSTGCASISTAGDNLGLAIGEAYSNEGSWNTQLNMMGTGHSILRIKKSSGDAADNAQCLSMYVHNNYSARINSSGNMLLSAAGSARLCLTSTYTCALNNFYVANILNINGLCLHKQDSHLLNYKSAHGTVAGIRFQTSDTTIQGYIYADSKHMGFLDADGQWTYFAKCDTCHDWRINNNRQMALFSACLCHCSKIEAATLCAPTCVQSPAVCGTSFMNSGKFCSGSSYLCSNCLSMAGTIKSTNCICASQHMCASHFYGDGSNLTGISAGCTESSGCVNQGFGSCSFKCKVANAKCNTAFGYQALCCAAGCQNTAVGHKALSVFRGNRNTAIGSHSMQGVVGCCCNNCPGDCNTSVGDSTLCVLTTGKKNLALGNNAGACLCTGCCNIFVGSAAGFGFTTGHMNTAVGRIAGGSAQATGSCNTFLGACAGGHITSGSNNILIGYCAGMETVIDTESNCMIIGNSSMQNGRICVNCFTFSGTVAKSSGSFRIVHPDPAKSATKDLWHSFVESPNEGDNIYRWQVETTNCTNTIILPDYYRHLNKDDMVWVSPYKNFGSAYGEVTADQCCLVICSNFDGCYNVLLIGTRKDPAAVNAWAGTSRDINGDSPFVKSSVEYEGEENEEGNRSVSSHTLVRNMSDYQALNGD